jgi:hypothetical protein
MKAPRFSGNGSISFGAVEYQLLFTNAGSPDAFTVRQSVAEEVTVMPDSSATRREQVLTSPKFLTKVDRLRWEASGKPPYASPTDHAGAEYRSSIPTGAWSFTPHGIAVTFKRVRELPASPAALAQEVTRLFGPTPPAASMLRQYGFLLATAPLTRATRKAVLEDVASLPGIRMCPGVFPGRSLQEDPFCVNGNPTSTEILLNRHTGVAVVVSQRVDHPTPLYPNMAVGDLAGSYTFSMQPTGS